MWDPQSLADVAADALRERDRQLREEQAVYGLDAMDEVEIHPILAAGFLSAGWGVLREQPYPSQWKRKKKEKGSMPLPRDRDRCDITLTTTPGRVIADSLTIEKAKIKAGEAARGTLFESLEPATEPPAPAEDDPADACWLEVKVVAQYSVEDGVPGPNRSYGSQLTRFASTDAGKLAMDRVIVHGGLVLVMFAQDERVIDHDASALLDKLMVRGLRVTHPVTRKFSIPDRIGNAVGAVVYIPLRAAPPIDD